MKRLSIDQLRRTPEWRAALQRDLAARQAAGLPRYVEDAATLDAIAQLVVAARRSRPKPRARGPGGKNAGGVEPAGSGGGATEDQGSGRPSQ